MTLRARLQRWLIQAAEGHFLLLACLAASWFGTATAAYPVTAVVIPATLLRPKSWVAITVLCALGSALGATLLVMAFHQLGWSVLAARFPSLSGNPLWLQVSAWVEAYGPLALFGIAATPLPQTPALIALAMTRHDGIAVFLAMLAGKLLKYGGLAWIARHFPERLLRSALGRWFASMGASGTVQPHRHPARPKGRAEG